MSTVAVVTPWLNHPELVADYEEVIASVDEAIVVDDGSDEWKVDVPGATVVRSDYNRGFAVACNLGLARATGDVVVFLNNDVAVADPFVRWADVFRDAVEPGVLAGPLRYEVHADVDGVGMPYIDGWCLAGWRNDLLELGGFDEGYLWPGDFTDNDLCLRARAAGMILREVRPPLVHKLATTIGHRNATDRLSDAFFANQKRYVDRGRQLLSAEEVAA